MIPLEDLWDPMQPEVLLEVGLAPSRQVDLLIPHVPDLTSSTPSPTS